MSRTPSARRVAPAPGPARPEFTEPGADQGIDGLAEAIKPHLRGWLHAGTFPLAVVAGIVLVVLAPTRTARVALGIFAATRRPALRDQRALPPVLLARGPSQRVLNRLDHANIFLIIAGTYTPFSVLPLSARPGDDAALARLGRRRGRVAFRVLWPHAPRWLYVPVYIALGWVAVSSCRLLARRRPASSSP